MGWGQGSTLLELFIAFPAHLKALSYLFSRQLRISKNSNHKSKSIKRREEATSYQSYMFVVKKVSFNWAKSNLLHVYNHHQDPKKFNEVIKLLVVECRKN